MTPTAAPVPQPEMGSDLGRHESHIMRQSDDLSSNDPLLVRTAKRGQTTTMTGATADSAEHGADATATGYVPFDGIYDEMVAADGSVRPAFTTISTWFSSASMASQSVRARKTERLLLDRFNDPRDMGQPWHLDIVPIAFSKDEWAKIEAAALQRARLYQAFLSDIYGEQTLLTSGTVPTDLILNDSSYLRPLFTGQPGSCPLTFLAIDLARDPAGNWRVIDVHTETPAGHGFVLANRMIMAEISPDLFRFSRTFPIGPFYQSLSQTLYEHAKGDDPTVAILTPSPKSAAFRGHAYMARYLGYLQVQGSDLRVVDQNVYLKTIDGLKRIDVLLRAIEGRRADPIELAPDGFEGPVGLVQAARQNPDLIANALGSAVVENRGLSPFMTGIAQHLLGEDLLIPDAPRLWLGQRAIRDTIAADLDDYIIYDAQEGTGSPGQAKSGTRAGAMSGEQRAALEQRMALDASLLVAEKPVGFATAPAWSEDGLRPKPFALRVFATGLKDGFQVMPGGVALTIDDDAAVALTSNEARSRDVWVVSPNTPPSSVTLSRMAHADSGIQRHSRNLQSRVADNLFWLGRYCERADATLRLVRQALTQTAPDLSRSSGRNTRLTRALNQILAKDGGADATAPGQPQNDGLADIIGKLCSEPDRVYGLPRTIDNIRRTALQCRDRLSTDSWGLLTGLSVSGLVCVPSNVQPLRPTTPDAEAAPPPEPEIANAHDLIETCDQLINQLSAFAGLTHENMTRNSGRQFLDMGRRLERALQLVELLDSLFTNAGDDDELRDTLTFALCVADSYLTFRSRYHLGPELKLVLDLLLIDETNPRSLVFQLAALSEQIDGLPRSSDDAVRATEQRMALDLLTRTRLVDLDEIVQSDDSGTRKMLKTMLDSVISELPQLSETISRHYFSLADEQPQRLRPHFPR